MYSRPTTWPRTPVRGISQSPKHQGLCRAPSRNNTVARIRAPHHHTAFLRVHQHCRHQVHQHCCQVHQHRCQVHQHSPRESSLQAAFTERLPACSPNVSLIISGTTTHYDHSHAKGCHGDDWLSRSHGIAKVTKTVHRTRRPCCGPTHDHAKNTTEVLGGTGGEGGGGGPNHSPHC